MSDNIQSKIRLNIWVIAGAIVVALILSIVLWMLLKATRGNMTVSEPATAILNVIEAPNYTDTPIIPTPTVMQTSSSGVPASPPPGDISIGTTVQVSGTGGDGLRLRSTPGLNGEVLFLGYEGEVFQVLEGPQEVDGYTWWYLTAPYDEKVQGWVVANYLSILQIP